MDGKKFLDFRFYNTLLCYMGHLYVPLSEHAKLIWEVHYSWVARHFGLEKTVEVLQKYFYWPKLQQHVGKYIKYCNSYAIPKSTIKN